MDAILELTLNIKEKYAMYLGCASLLRLSAYVAGYELALYKHGVSFERSMSWGYFNEFVSQKYRIPLSNGALKPLYNANAAQITYIPLP